MAQEDNSKWPTTLWNAMSEPGQLAQVVDADTAHIGNRYGPFGCPHSISMVLFAKHMTTPGNLQEVVDPEVAHIGLPVSPLVRISERNSPFGSPQVSRKVERTTERRVHDKH